MLGNWKTGAMTVALSIALAGYAYPKEKYHGGSLEARAHGYEHGYRDGLHNGVGDREHHKKLKIEIKDEDKGYESYMGDKGLYKQGYRDGFTAGYDDGYNNRPGRFNQIYGPYDRAREADRYDEVYAERHYGGNDVAYDIGYRDGLGAGAGDFDHHRVGRPEELRDFREADHGYRSAYGDKLVYQRQYRDGFEAGYRDGLRGIR
jgi:hypothetical protein